MDKYAIISVSDKTGVLPFAKALVERFGYTILSTGGTARFLQESGVPVTLVESHTGFPEMMDGRLKTLHPKIHGGILCDRDIASHVESAAKAGIALIDVIVVNLYPFEQTIAKPGVTDKEAIENIDIGGPSLLRGAAKNHRHVSVITDPADYDRLIQALDRGTDLRSMRREFAAKVFDHTARYDRIIADYFASTADQPAPGAIAGLPEVFSISGKRADILRYGENPHQQAALYGNFHDRFHQLQGKQLSFCNILDVTAASNLIGEFQDPTLAILKHTNPCGVASAESLSTAWDAAFETDKQAPFGGIIVVNRTVDEELCERIRQIWCEIIIAPGFDAYSLDRFSKKKDLRLLEARQIPDSASLLDIRSVAGGFLVQEADTRRYGKDGFRVVTERQPTQEEWDSMLFGWKVVKHVKSNAIVYTKGTRTLGVGAGQMSRVDSSKVAVWKAGEAGLDLKGSAMISDALIPFPDGLIAAADAGATTCIQTGGSVRDDQVIQAANERGMAMVFTGYRHFKH
ncbi:MAG: Bifunctional purine biosynthesis protein PurH [Verrucomicrobia bacterium ADurb.Bin474]|nr:MAG: Bifunctional purine biosynthesis protein PurH [Verrucomicrobia bacterium ADurb.Bin474]